MKNANQAALAASPQTEVTSGPVALGDVAPVVPSEITNTQNVANDMQVESYCNKIVAGEPTGKSFPNKLSEMIFTDEQREAIRAARATHKLNCIASKKELIRIVQAKGVDTVGSRKNAKGTMGAIRWAKKEAITDKNGDYKPGFLFGAKPKNA